MRWLQDGKISTYTVLCVKIVENVTFGRDPEVFIKKEQFPK